MNTLKPTYLVAGLLSIKTQRLCAAFCLRRYLIKKIMLMTVIMASFSRYI